MFQIQMFSLKVFANDTARPAMRCEKLNRELKIFIYFCSFAVLNPLLQLFFLLFCFSRSSHRLKPSQDSQSFWLENSKQEKQRKEKSSTDLLPPPASIKFSVLRNIYNNTRNHYKLLKEQSSFLPFFFFSNKMKYLLSYLHNFLFLLLLLFVLFPSISLSEL